MNDPHLVDAVADARSSLASHSGVAWAKAHAAIDAIAKELCIPVTDGVSRVDRTEAIDQGYRVVSALKDLNDHTVKSEIVSELIEDLKAALKSAEEERRRPWGYQR